MPRKLRPELPGGFFHVTTRGVLQAAVFLDELDYDAWLRIVARTITRFRWLCHAYCAMPNHFHLLVETPEPTRSAGMRHLNGSIAQRFNTRYDASGHVLQGRYSATLVERESHFSEVPRYIVLNPVRAGLCRKPEDWRWSSYRATAGLVAPPPFLTVETVLGTFADSRPAAQDAYRRHVAAGLVRASQVPGRGPEAWLGGPLRPGAHRSTRRTWLWPGPRRT